MAATFQGPIRAEPLRSSPTRSWSLWGEMVVVGLIALSLAERSLALTLEDRSVMLSLGERDRTLTLPDLPRRR